MVECSYREEVYTPSLPRCQPLTQDEAIVLHAKTTNHMRRHAGDQGSYPTP